MGYRPHNAIDLTGQRFGALVAVRQVGHTRRRAALWLCRCDCGAEVKKRGDKLRYGRVKTCALNGHRWTIVRPPAVSRLHPIEHATWVRMNARCFNKKHHRYKSYGGRGIIVCPQWKDSFEQFFRDMGRRPSNRHTIERIDVNGNYEPGNCRWATREEQARNLQRSVYVEYEGQRMLLLDVCEKLGLKRGVVYGRLKIGWTLAQALSVPVRPKAPRKLKRRKKKL